MAEDGKREGHISGIISSNTCVRNFNSDSERQHVPEEKTESHIQAGKRASS